MQPARADRAVHNLPGRTPGRFATLLVLLFLAGTTAHAGGGPGKSKPAGHNYGSLTGDIAFGTRIPAGIAGGSAGPPALLIDGSLLQRMAPDPAAAHSWVTQMKIDSGYTRSKMNRAEILLSTGPEFSVQAMGPVTLVSPYLEYEWRHSAGRTLFHSAGFGLVLAGQAGSNGTISWYIDNDVLLRRYDNTGRFAFNDEKNGPNFHSEAQVTYKISELTAISLKGEYERQWARKKYQSFNQFIATTSLVHVFKSPLGGERYWSLALTASADHLRFDRTNPFIGQTRRRRDLDLALSAQISIPVAARLSAEFSLTQHWNASSIPAGTYRQTSIQTALRFRF